MHMHTGDRQSPIKYVHRLDIMAYTNHRFLKKMVCSQRCQRLLSVAVRANAPLKQLFAFFVLQVSTLSALPLPTLTLALSVNLYFSSL